MKRILNLTHNDLDGVASALAVKMTHNSAGEHVTTKFCTYANINQLLLQGLTNYKNRYDRIVLSDICFEPKRDNDSYETNELRWLVKFKLPEAIVDYVKSGGELVVLDHHPRVVDMYKQYQRWLHPLSICETKDTQGVARAGSELAARYYAEHTTSALKLITDFCELAGDYDVWRDPLGYGGMLAIGLELMDDPHGALNSMQKAVFLLGGNYQGNKNQFQEAFANTVLGEYTDLAKEKLEIETEKALASAIKHENWLTEIHSDFFASLIAMKIYDKTEGVVVVRYDKDREKCRRMSLRRKVSFEIDLGRVAKQFGGGGHPVAAGVSLQGAQKVDDVIHALRDAVNLGL